MENKNLKFAVLGCGNGGQALAADISLKGFPTNIGTLPQFEERLEHIRRQGRIRISDASGEKFAGVNLITSNVAELIRNVEIVFIAAPAYRHELFVKTLAPHFEDGQFIVFVSHFGAMNFKAWTRQSGVKADVTPVESISLLYSARLTQPASVKIFATKKSLPVAALPSARTGDFLKKISPVFPQMVAAENVLFTSLNNVGPVLQTALLLLNTGRIEHTAGKGWNLISEGFTPSVAKVILRVESERASIVDFLGVTNVPITGSFKQFAQEMVTAETFSKAMRSNPVFANPEIASPESLRDRFIGESVPFGLVPWSSIADMYSIPVPTIKSLICLASTVNDVDYLKEGITVEKLGINKISPDELLRRVR